MSSWGPGTGKTESRFDMAIQRWAERHCKTFLMAQTALNLAVLAGPTFDCIQRLRNGEVDQRLPRRPEIRHWLTLYRQHRPITRVVADECPSVWGNGEQYEAETDGLRAFGVLATNKPEELKSELRKVSKEKFHQWLRIGHRQARRDYRETLRECREVLDEKVPIDVLLDRKFEQSPELHFFSRVSLPCFIVYEAMPCRLMRAARQGDVSAIEKLLRLDDATYHEPRVAEWFNGADGLIRRDRVTSATRWMAEGLEDRLTQQGVKYSLGALIVLLSENMPYLDWPLRKWKFKPITCRQLRSLFDAVHKDRTHGKVMNDPDFDGINLDSFQKAIQRHKKLWPEVPRIAKGGHKST